MDDNERLGSLLDLAGFPRVDKVNISSERLVAMTRQDKKARAGKAEYVFPAGIGAMHKYESGYGIPVEDADVLAVLRAIRQR